MLFRFFSRGRFESLFCLVLPSLGIKLLHISLFSLSFHCFVPSSPSDATICRRKSHRFSFRVSGERAQFLSNQSEEADCRCRFVLEIYLVACSMSSSPLKRRYAGRLCVDLRFVNVKLLPLLCLYSLSFHTWKTEMEREIVYKERRFGKIKI